MLIQNLKDILLDDDGDIVISSTEVDENTINDFALAVNTDAIKQHIDFRLNTFLGTCALWNQLGNDIELMKHKRNTKENALIIKEKLQKCLTFGDVFDIINIEIIPVSQDLIIYYIQMQFEDGITFTMQLNFDFDNGVRWSI